MNQNEKAELFRRRFYGRQDVFGKSRHIKKDDGTSFKQYYPVCAKIWTDKCNLKLKNGKFCANCEIKEYTPVSNESVLLHISGQEEHIFYCLHDDGTINFGACDFDMKAGKEKFGYTFEDVKKVTRVFKEWNIPYGIARSTGAGFHVYVFFNVPMNAARFRSLMYAVFERTGFMEENRAGIRPIAEIFPKADYISNGGLGNGLKPCMVESRFEIERNCWVDDNNVMIPAGYQWEYFRDIPSCSTALIDEIIAREEIPVYETNSISGSTSRAPRGPRDKYQAPVSGSIEKVLEGCQAFRRIKHKCFDIKNGKLADKIGHNEGFGLFHLAMNTADGIRWFDENVPGWSQTDSDRRQLDQSLDRNYAPWTCQTMQQKGVCASGTKCFDAKPPVDIIEGEVIERKEVPRNEWPQPSPIRYGFGKGADFMSLLVKETKELASEQDFTLREQKLRVVVERAQVFDKKQREALMALIKELKLKKVPDIKVLFRDAEVEHEESMKDSATTRDDMVMCGATIYKQLKPHGYAEISLTENKERSKTLCDFSIILDEDRKYFDDEKLKDTVTSGYLEVKGLKYAFEVTPDIWADNRKLYQFFIGLVGADFNPLLEDMGVIRQAATAFSAKKGVKKVNYSYCQGWEGDTFVMPSVLVDKDGVRANAERKVDLSKKEHASGLDFQILSDHDFKEVLFHLKKDFLKAWPTDMVMIGLAQTMLAPLITYLKIEEKPSLFFEGLTGTGKTGLQKMLQRFFGKFTRLKALNSTAKGILIDANEFRDCFLILDDYKEIDFKQRHAVEEYIQYAYDGNSRGASTRSGNARAERAVRCIALFSGELFPANEASLVARSILVETKQRNMLDTSDAFQECTKYSHLYSGVTARFISWFLNQQMEQIKTAIADTSKQLQLPIAGVQNADRIAHNLAYNHVAWRLFMGFMLSSGAIDAQEHDAYIKQHLELVTTLRGDMVTRCSEEQNGRVFVETLRDLINSGQVAISNLLRFNPERVPVIGFAKADRKDAIYLYPSVVVKIVKDQCRHTVLRGTQRAFANQLVAMRVITDARKGRNTVAIYHDGSTREVWCISLELLGIDVQGPIRRLDPAPVGSDGIV